MIGFHNYIFCTFGKCFIFRSCLHCCKLFIFWLTRWLFQNFYLFEAVCDRNATGVLPSACHQCSIQCESGHFTTAQNKRESLSQNTRDTPNSVQNECNWTFYRFMLDENAHLFLNDKAYSVYVAPSYFHNFNSKEVEQS